MQSFDEYYFFKTKDNFNWHWKKEHECTANLVPLYTGFLKSLLLCKIFKNVY